MLLKDFYIRVASSEQECTTFLREHQLLKDVNNIDPCHKCGTEMCEKRRKNRNGEFVPIFRCPKKGCQTSHLVRQGNAFFYFTDLNSRVTCKLTLSEIMEIVFMFVIEIPLIQAAELTGRSNKTIMLGGDKPPANTDEGAQVQNNRNHGARIDGPWVFGLKHGNYSRYFYVERRDKDTLLPIIKRECEGGSVIHSDE
ncbi:unnamed protein product [Macrosiphum euphorbiae]|uniref:Transposase n=1 Tax=Macrosiphum euphorbiae TaxID=13131 RepID=A0AAV0WUP1_9HEMI|nr:unnamed protein product [Macrosiphum euphorbiae]